MDTLETGISTYRVNAVSLVSYDESKVFEQVQDKIEHGTVLKKEEAISLAFTPIMGGKWSKKDKILKAIRLTREIDETYRNDLQSILYAFASKFLVGKELDAIREELKMTELGKSLIEEGIEKGIVKGIEKAKLEVAKTAISEGMEDEMISRLTGVSIQEIQILRALL